MQKLRNRVQFEVPEGSSLGDGLGVGFGMLGQAGSGKLRISARQSKNIVKKIKVNSYGSSGAAKSGPSSSFAFIPVQGIELSNPRRIQTSLAAELKAPISLRLQHFLKLREESPLFWVFEIA